MKKPVDKAAPKEDKKPKDTKVPITKDNTKKTEKKEDVKTASSTTTSAKVISKKPGPETKTNVGKKEDIKKEDDVEGDKKKKSLTESAEKKEFSSSKNFEEEVIITTSDKDPSQDLASTFVKSTQASEVSNDSKGLNSASTNLNVIVDMKDSLAQKEKDINQLKQNINEKKQYQDDINKILKENNTLKKDKADLNSAIDQLNKDNEMFSNELSLLLEENEKLVKTNLDMTSKIKEMEEKLMSIETLESDLENLKIDLEIKTEECEGMKLELANAKNISSMDLDPDSEKARIFELEQNLKATENALLKLDEQKSNEIYKLQKDLKEKVEKAKNADVLPLKEEEIKLLKIKLEEAHSSNSDLREQLNIFSGASMMMDGLISQKLGLELELDRERKEKEGLKIEIDTTEQLLLEYEDAQKLSQEIIREKENSIIEYNNSMNKLKFVIEELGKKEENLIKSYNQIKNENTILREEVNTSSNQSVNVDQILNKNSNIFSRLNTFMRRSVIEKLIKTDYTLQKFKSIIISEMIPKQLLDKGGYDSFDRYLLLVSVRKKLYFLIFNIIENDLLKLENNDSKDKSIELDNTKYFTFLKNLINTLIDLNRLCLSLEITFSNLSKNEFKLLSKAPLWNNILAAAKIIENLSLTIKSDNFSIKFQFEPLKTIIKVIQDEAKNNLKINLEEEMNPICLYNNEILKFISTLLINYNLEKNIYPAAAKVVSNLYKQTKKTLKRIDEKFVFNFSFQGQVFEMDNNYYIKFIECSKTLYDNNFDCQTPKYETLSEPLNKLCIILLNYLEKLDKEDINKEVENRLPLNSWIELCLEVRNELIESGKTRENLDNSKLKLDEIKIEKMQLEGKIEDSNRNKLVNDKKLAEALLVAGKVPQLEEQINEFKRKIEKYNTTIDNLREQLEIESSKAKNLQLKVDNNMPSNIISKKPDRSNRRGVIPGDSNPIASLSLGGNNLMTDSIPLLNTICDLQKERKYLKSKLMKEKLEDLLGENSYINRYIDKVSKLNYQDEKEKLMKVEGEMDSLNRNFKYVRMKLCTPKILDLSSKDYNFEKTKVNQDNKLAKLRVDYVRNIDKIMYSIFGDSSLDKTFKEIIDNDIMKTLKYISEKKLLVGKVSFGTSTLPEGTKKTVPVYLSETSLKLLNKTFLN